MIQFESFASLVEEMRLEQKMYFKERTITHLKKALELEKRVDKMLIELHHQFNSDGAVQLPINFPD